MTLGPTLGAKLLPEGNWARSRSALGLLVVCGFLTLCRKDFMEFINYCIISHTNNCKPNFSTLYNDKRAIYQKKTATGL